MQLDAEMARMVSAALLRLRMRSPFFATLALFARIEATELLPTAATDGRDIFINPAFFRPLSAAEQDGVLLHEVLHAALLHIPRRGGRDHLHWNIAADIVVNAIVLEDQRLALPPGVVRVRQLEQLRVEEVYELLAADLARLPPAGWSDLLEHVPGDCGGQASGVPLSGERRAALEAYWRHALAQARAVAASAGHGHTPAGLRRELGAVGPAQLDWRSYLWRFLVQTPSDFVDYDRRFVGRRVYLETLAGESVHVYICVDTSGSVDDRQLQMFLAEVAGILASYPHLRCALYYADAALDGPYPLVAGARLPPPTGGGGTDFRPFFKHVAESRDSWTTALCVYLTDGFGTFPAQQPELPALWVVTPGGLDLDDFPFGQAVRLLLHH